MRNPASLLLLIGGLSAAAVTFAVVNRPQPVSKQTTVLAIPSELAALLPQGFKVVAPDGASVNLHILAPASTAKVRVQSDLKMGTDAFPTADAKKHVGEKITIVGTVSTVKFWQDMVFVNMDGDHPNQKFTAVVKPYDPATFGAVKLSALVGKNVGIDGEVKLYKGKPQIILESPDQISIVEQ